jgi:signal transduction histidine kinase
MQIRTKLTLRFILVVAAIQLFGSLAIYFFSADYRRELFYDRLKNKANSTAKLLMAVEEIDASLLKKMETDNPVSLPYEKINIYNYRNEIIFSTDDSQFLQITQQILNDIRLKGEIRFTVDNFEILGFLYKDLEKNERLTIITCAKDIYGYRRLGNLRTILIIVFATSTILVLVSGWIYSGRALKPISKVIEQVNNISASSLNLRVHKGQENDEIADLANTFNQMLNRLETAFISQKNFIANASHELRTPLTAITGELEVSLMKERTLSEYRNVMISVFEDMKRLSSISDRLLLLAQSDSDKADKSFETVRMDELLWDVQSELIKLHDHYKIDVIFDESITDEEKLEITGNRQLIKSVISNLIDNGCKYSPDHKVDVQIRHDGKFFIMQFTDQGIGIESDDLPHIFEPFYRGKNSVVTRGHGIGLTLVEKIINLHNGFIEVKSETGKGSTFVVKIPSGNQSKFDFAL